jgi:hypothetical protein
MAYVDIPQVGKRLEKRTGKTRGFRFFAGAPGMFGEGDWAGRNKT